MLTELAALVAEPFRRRLAANGHERAASLIEYAFLVALIAIVCILAVTFFGQKTSANFSRSGSLLQ